MEWRTREIFNSMSVFTVLVVVVFNFAIGSNPEVIRLVAPGVLWVALLFATVLGLQRAVQIESEEDCFQGVLLGVTDRSALFIAKAIVNLCYLLVVAVCAVLLFGVWFNLDVLSNLGGLCVVMGLGAFGLSLLGTLFSMMSINTRTRGLQLPLLFLPVSIPLTIAAVYATGELVQGGGLADVSDYLTLLVVFDVVFLTVAILVFDYVVEE